MCVVFLLPSSWHPGIRKRVRALQQAGIEATVLAFERSYHPNRALPHDYTILGNLENTRYWQRLWPFIKAIPKIRAAAIGARAIYAFGLDLLLLAWLSRFALRPAPKLIYEVRDIRAVLTSQGIVARLLRSLERFLLRRIDLLVTTSMAYVTGYFQGWQHMGGVPFQVVENKLEAGWLPLVEQDRQPMADGVLRIGYFGLLRCPRSWEILKRAAERGEGRIQVYLRGIPVGLPNLAEEARATPNIEYGGPFTAPDDLPSIFAQVDMVWACYGYEGERVGNWCWARTNRFYESCFFRRPMFSQLGNEDGRVVKALGLGLALDLSDVDGSVERILRVTAADIWAWQRKLSQLPMKLYVHSDEHERLAQAILGETQDGANAKCASFC